MNRIVFICALLMGAAQWIACDDPTGPLNPDHEITKIENSPDIFWPYWERVVSCTKFYWIKNSRFNDLSFYRVGDDVDFSCREIPSGCAGLFTRSTKSIYIAGAQLAEPDTLVIEHELAHAIFMDSDHSKPGWERCGLMKKYIEQRLYLIMP